MDIDTPQTQTPEPNRQLQQQGQARIEREGRIIKDLFPPAVLAAIVGKRFGDAVSHEGFKAFSDQTLAACGSPKDPLEAMMMVQLFWAHHQIGALQGKVASAKTPEAIAVYSAAAIKQMAECRKVILALRQYRSPVVPQQVTVVKQQNLAAGNQNVAMIDGNLSSESTSEKTTDTELVSNQARLNHVELNTPISAANCWETEPVEAKRVNIRSSREAQAGGRD